MSAQWVKASLFTSGREKKYLSFLSVIICILKAKSFWDVFLFHPLVFVFISFSIFFCVSFILLFWFVFLESSIYVASLIIIYFVLFMKCYYSHSPSTFRVAFISIPVHSILFHSIQFIWMVFDSSIRHFHLFLY